MLRVVEVTSVTHVSRVIYGAIIGLALVVALEHQPPGPAVMVGSLLASALVVGLAELYSEIVGTEVRACQRVARARVGEIAADVGAVAFGFGFLAVSSCSPSPARWRLSLPSRSPRGPASG